MFFTYFCKMERLRQLLTGLPPFMFSVLTLLAILWLTLAPQPLGENPPQLFPGADKVAHALMFGGLAIMLLLDWQRKHGWQMTAWLILFSFCMLSFICGVAIEFAQLSMNLGRGFETGDILADGAGCVGAGLFWLICQERWAQFR